MAADRGGEDLDHSLPLLPACSDSLLPVKTEPLSLDLKAVTPVPPLHPHTAHCHPLSSRDLGSRLPATTPRLGICLCLDHSCPPLLEGLNWTPLLPEASPPGSLAQVSEAGRKGQNNPNHLCLQPVESTSPPNQSSGRGGSSQQGAILLLHCLGLRPSSAKSQEGCVVGIYSEAHLAHPFILSGQLWPRKGQWLAQVPNSQQLSTRPKGPLIAVKGAHVPSSGHDEIGLVTCSLSPSLLENGVALSCLGGGRGRPVVV